MKYLFLILILFFSQIFFVSCRNNAKDAISDFNCPFHYVGQRTSQDLQYSIKDSTNTISDLEEDGIVANPQVAANIAYVYAKSIYGDNIKRELPFEIALVNESVWIIRGGGNVSEDIDINRKGGIMTMGIRKFNGEILFVGHGE